LKLMKPTRGNTRTTEALCDKFKRNFKKIWTLYIEDDLDQEP